LSISEVDRSLECVASPLKSISVGRPATNFQLEDHRDRLESDISVHGLTSARATAAYVHANPSEYGTTAEGMCSLSTLCNQLNQLNGLV
jgi:hypothetical protein